MNGTVGQGRHQDVASLMEGASVLVVLGAVALVGGAFVAHGTGERVFRVALSLVLIAAALLAHRAASIVRSGRRALADALAVARSGAPVDLAGTAAFIGPPSAQLTAWVAEAQREAGTRQRIAGMASAADDLLVGHSRMAVTLRSQVEALREAKSSAERALAEIRETADHATHLGTSVVQSSASIEQMVRSVRTASMNVNVLADTVNSVSSAIGELAASITQVAGNAQEANTLSLVADTKARDGGKAVERLVESTREIANDIGSIVNKMEELGTASAQIGNIVEVIDTIADPTNLLALNAAFEAARAGEHGRGFAVVADEVRKLAENSASSTKEIGLLIKDIQAKTVEVVRSTTASGAKASTGLQMADLAGRAINDILEAVNDASQLIDQISKAAREQASGSSSIVNSVEQMTALMRESVKWLDEQDAANQQMIDAIAAMRQLTERMSGAIERQRAACEAIDQAAKRLETTAETSLEINTSMEEAIRALREQAHGETDGMPPLPDAQPHERLILATGGRN
jgi:methyl-accepting chemotaxis protein